MYREKRKNKEHMGNIEDKQQGGIFDSNHINSYFKYTWSKYEEGTKSCGK